MKCLHDKHCLMMTNKSLSFGSTDGEQFEYININACEQKGWNGDCKESSLNINKVLPFLFAIALFPSFLVSLNFTIPSGSLAINNNWTFSSYIHCVSVCGRNGIFCVLPVRQWNKRKLWIQLKLNRVCVQNIVNFKNIKKTTE